MADLNTAFQSLRNELRASGAFDPAPLRCLVSLPLHVSVSLALFVASARLAGPLSVVAFVAASFVFYRLGWLMHDAAHGGALGPPKRGKLFDDRIFAPLVAGVVGEFVSGWKYGHNAHHAAPNVLGRDGDQSERWDPERRYPNALAAFVGVLLVSKVPLPKGRSVLVPKTLLLVGLRDGYYCRKHFPARFRRELAAVLAGHGTALAIFTVLFGAWSLPLYLAHTAIGLLYLNTVFAGNHYDLEVFTPEQAARIPFAELQARTSRNYPPGLLAHFVFGGLEYQLEHHLFPDLPRHQLRRVAPRVRAFCAEHGLPYETLPFGECLARVVRFHVGPRAAPLPA